jgi:hypothetical protein
MAYTALIPIAHLAFTKYATTCRIQKPNTIATLNTDKKRCDKKLYYELDREKGYIKQRSVNASRFTKIPYKKYIIRS